MNFKCVAKSHQADSFLRSQVGRVSGLNGNHRAKFLLEVLSLGDELEPPSPLAALALRPRVLGQQVRLDYGGGGGRGAVVGGAGDAADRLHPRHAEPLEICMTE